MTASEAQQKEFLALVAEISNQLDGASGDALSQDILAKPIDDLGWDSLERMELVLKAEEIFAIDLDEEDVLACETLQDVFDLIATKT